MKNSPWFPQSRNHGNQEKASAWSLHDVDSGNNKMLSRTKVETVGCDKGNVFAIGWRHISNGASIKPVQKWFGVRKPNKGDDWIYIMLGTEF